MNDDRETKPSAGCLASKDECERCGSEDDVHLSRGLWLCGGCRSGKAPAKEDKDNANR